MAARSAKECEQTVRDRGFSEVSAWTDEANAHYEPHKHSGPSTIMIVAGQLTIKFPDDLDGRSVLMKPGDSIDIDAGRLHEVWIGESGCTTVNGS
ncbi:hypothetical protein D0Z07_9060 [Hyphodiscus hymeniophilus]|uniref:Cupin type-2 domain-containing protein n=1 Tax=Hyphodiscus hymeniophilus TaxID=353542 RepID=A0A9P6VDJ6_9HELO|nr:hypothetical protein D0Z07_9060 [Hyphodiscus hymeniophilus]